MDVIVNGFILDKVCLFMHASHAHDYHCYHVYEKYSSIYIFMHKIMHMPKKIHKQRTLDSRNKNDVVWIFKRMPTGHL